MGRRRGAIAIAVAAVFAALLAFWPRSPAPPAGVVVYAAGGFAPALREAAGAFEAAAGLPLVVIEGTTQALAAEIHNGAEAALFIAPDPEAIEALAAGGWLAGAPEEVARNRLVFATAAPGELAAAKDGTSYFAGGKLVTGDPETTALGRYAREALVNLGFPGDVETYIEPAASAREAVALLLEKKALEGILYRTDALAAEGITVLDEIPESAHAPIAYLAAPVRAGKAEHAALLINFLKSEAFKTILRAKGFGLPPEGEAAGNGGR